MKNTLIAALCMVLVALMIMLFGFNLPEKSYYVSPDPVLLLIEDDTGSFLLQLRLGAQMALDELGCDLITEVIHPEDVSAGWQDKSFSGALVYIENEEIRSAALSALDEADLPSVVIGSWDGAHTAVCQDDAQLGRSAANLAEGYSEVSLEGGSTAARNAAAGILGARLRESVDPMNSGACIIALDSKTAFELCNLKAAGGWKCGLYTADPGENRAAQLERGVTQALLLPSPYASGYRAASEALWDRKPALYSMPFFTVKPETMYDAENVKLVFPLLN